MKNLLKEEINEIQYLFGYKRGFVISEQDTNQNELKIKYELSKLGGEYGSEIQKYYKDKIDGKIPVEPEKRYLDLIDGQYEKLTPEQSNRLLAVHNKKDTEINLPNIPDEIIKIEDQILGNAPKSIIDALNQNRDERSVGVDTSKDYNVAKSKAFVQGQINLAKKMNVSSIDAQRIIDATQNGQTYVVVAKV